MKKSLYLSMVILFVCSGPLFCQQDEDVLQETVRVVNVEVPVRVYLKGQPVDNLTKNDFTLFEGGKRQEIHGFILKRKKIKVHELELDAQQERVPKSRYFVLVFRITHYNDYIKEGLDYVFENVLNTQDQLLVFVNDRSAFFESLADKVSVKTRVNFLLEDVSLKARNDLLLYVKRIESVLNKHKFEMTLRQSGGHGNPIQQKHRYIEEYLRKFLDIWKIYKKKNLVPDINTYYNFARFLKNINKEKWVINFYQFELFPDILINSENMRRIRRLIGEWQISENQELVIFSRIISRLINEIGSELAIAKDFPSDEVAKIFHNVDATFHSVFMRTTMSTLMEDMEYREIASELENSLRSITDLTGGKLVVSNKLDTALDRISEVEDIYYILTYAPKNPDTVGKIKLKATNRKYDLVYSPNLRSGFLGQFLEDKEKKGKEPRIEDLRFKRGKLMFGISDFFWDKKEGGKLTVRIRINTPRGQSVFDQKKAIRASQEKINLSLNFNTLKSGEYDFVVDVTDLSTSMTATGLLKARI